MHFATVDGVVVSTHKTETLKGLPLKVLIPCDENRNPLGDPIIAVDDVGSRPGDFVIWVGKREASMAIKDASLKNMYPVDAAVTGIVDDIS